MIILITQLESNLWEENALKTKYNQLFKSLNRKEQFLKSYSNNCYALSEKQIKSKNTVILSLNIQNNLQITEISSILFTITVTRKITT